mgnify:CR=1 FL=1|jgi:hypothetical protein
MKTPMQELIEQFNEETTRAEQRGDFEIMRLLQVAKSLAEMKLNREKEVICNAFSDARHGAVESRWTAEEYFEETFNTKEK